MRLAIFLGIPCLLTVISVAAISCAQSTQGTGELRRVYQKSFDDRFLLLTVQEAKVTDRVAKHPVRLASSVLVYRFYWLPKQGAQTEPIFVLTKSNEEVLIGGVNITNLEVLACEKYGDLAIIILKQDSLTTSLVISSDKAIAPTSEAGEILDRDTETDGPIVKATIRKSVDGANPTAELERKGASQGTRYALKLNEGKYSWEKTGAKQEPATVPSSNPFPRK